MKKIIFLVIATMLIFTVVTAGEYIIVEKDGPKKSFRSLSVQEDITKDIKVNRRFTSFNGFSAELSKSEYEKLKLDPRYIVHETREFSSHLDASVPQISAGNLWPMLQNSTNLTGIGQTVCVIDSGVNYSHPNLGSGYGANTDMSYTVIGGHDFCSVDATPCTGEDTDPMDDYGHGTHVAGIITSNNTTYKGIAPGTKIIAMKVMNGTGKGNSPDLIAGIEWCTNNKSKFNISVISMSLGDTSHELTYCDSESAGTVTAAIRAAIAQNITVVVSAGNTGPFTTGISWPACISGVIPVGSVHFDDSTINYQRGDLFQVIAPGGGTTPSSDYITSTATSGGFEGRRGTSMAAPHVAGLVAILNQFYNLQTGLNLTNASVKTALNKTRKFLDDSAGTGHLFPRIDPEWSIYSLDLINPNVTLIEPQDSEVNTSVNQTFTANITDFALQNLTFYLWNLSDLVNETNQSLSGQETEFSITIYNLATGEYNWTIQAYDMNNKTFTAANNSLTVSSSTTINYPSNNTFTNQNNTNFSCISKTSTGTNLDNITYSITNSSDFQVYTNTTTISGTQNTTIINYTLPSETSYTWNCKTMNNESELTSSENYTLTYETEVPSLNLTTPYPSSQTATSYIASFYFNVSDNYNETTCELYVGGTSENSTTISNYSSSPQEINLTLGAGTHVWKINCTDQAGNSNVSGENTFTVTAPVDGDSGGGSGGSSGGGGGSSEEVRGSLNNPHNSTELQKGVQKLLRRTMQVYITNIKNETHSITLDKIINKTAEFTIESEPIKVSLKQGESIKLNISGKEFYDLLITAVTVTDIVATINVTEIKEPHPDYEAPVEREFGATEEDDGIIAQPEYKRGAPIFLIGFLAVIFITLLIIVIQIYSKKSNSSTKEIKIKELKSLRKREKKYKEKKNEKK